MCGGEGETGTETSVESLWKKRFASCLETIPTSQKQQRSVHRDLGWGKEGEGLNLCVQDDVCSQSSSETCHILKHLLREESSNLHGRYNSSWELSMFL